METMQITSLEQLPAGLTLLLKKIDNLEAILHSSHSQAPEPVKDDLKFYSRKETAEIFDISLTTLDEYIKTGAITACRFGTRIRFTREAIEQAMKSKQINPARKIA